MLTRDRLDELVPIEPARMADLQVIEWDKDDIDALKFMKVDCLALGMLTCVKRAFDMLDEHEGSRDRRLQAGHALDDEHDRYGIFAIDEEQAAEIAFDSLKKNVDYSMFWNWNFRKLHRAPRTRGRKPGSEPKG